MTFDTFDTFHPSSHQSFVFTIYPRAWKPSSKRTAFVLAVRQGSSLALVIFANSQSSLGPSRQRETFSSREFNYALCTALSPFFRPLRALFIPSSIIIIFFFINWWRLKIRKLCFPNETKFVGIIFPIPISIFKRAKIHKGYFLYTQRYIDTF